MKKKLINAFLFLALCFNSYIVSGQAPLHQIKASIEPGPGLNQVSVYLMPDFDDATRYFNNLNICVTLPVSATTPAPKSQPVFTATASGIVSIPVASYNDNSYKFVETIGDKVVYTFNPQVSGSTITPIAAGTRLLAVTFSISGGGTNTDTVSLADYSSIGGGNTTFSAFYVQLNSGQVSNSDTAQMFYTSGGPGSKITNHDGGVFVSADAPVVLPVTLIDFTATKSRAACAIDLKWRVAKEVNFKNYEVQHSTNSNGLNYTTIATIAAQGLSNYSSVDAVPASGVNYYRLKMNDYDGKFTYSKIIPVNSNCQGSIIQVWPNPAIDMVNVTGLTGKNNLVVMDATGRQVATYTTLNVNQKIDMSKFNSGNYTIMITSAEGGVTTLKLMKI